MTEKLLAAGGIALLMNEIKDKLINKLFLSLPSEKQLEILKEILLTKECKCDCDCSTKYTPVFKPVKFKRGIEVEFENAKIKRYSTVGKFLSEISRKQINKISVDNTFYMTFESQIVYYLRRFNKIVKIYKATPGIVKITRYDNHGKAYTATTR